MKFFSSKRRMIAAAIILLALFTIRPGASRLKSRIIYSISAGVNRPVDIGAVHVQLLPRPAFTLHNLVVYDDPSFGAEPMLRASEVTAPIRLTSLFRRRLEIARLDLTEPSLNLVHRQDGHWNLEALLERSAHIPLAPTAKARSERRPGFPYIEGTSGRINFKNGPEKKPYAFTNADFSLWQESENTWGVRLKAQPFRTDMNLNDTGLLLVNGTWQRAETLRDTPVELTVELSQAQLGQISKLITGNDQGWRGEILLDMTLKGTPGALQIAANSSIDDFRRYDITSGTALRMRARCDAEYSTETHEFSKIMCNAPVGNGLITLTGNMGFPGSHRYLATMTAEKVPAEGLVMLLQRVKRNLPDDLEADGTIKASVAIQNDGASLARWQGHGTISDLHLSSPSNKSEIGPETLPFVLSTDSGQAPHKPVPSNRTLQTGMRIEIGPLHLGVIRPGAATVRGLISRSGYNLAIAGEMDIARALRLARVAGLPAIASTADGSAQLDLQIIGNWTSPGKGFNIPQVTGNARLRNVQVVVPGTGSPLELASAELQLLPDAVHVSKLNAKVAGASWAGFIDLPRGCGTPDACPVHFSMYSKRVGFTDLNAWINPGAKKRPWYRVLGATSENRPAWWTTLRAIGKISAERLDLHQIQATQVSANLNLENGKLQLSALHGDLLGGMHSGDWRVEFAKKPAICKGTGTLAGISLASIAEAMNNAWVTGFGTGAYEVSGPCPSDFWQSAEGKLHVEVNDGIFPHVLLPESTEPLQANEINGEARLHGGTIEITNAQLIGLDSTYRLTGTASLKREVNLKLTRVASGDANIGYSIGGTLETPRIAPLSRNEQASLKAATPK